MDRPTRIKEKIHKLNPCNSGEDSIRWALISVLFPDCWCCAGLRGFIYGYVTAFIIAALIYFAG